jgi:hypothetical protein
MKTYRLVLHRSYFVDIEAKSQRDARTYAEYFLGDPTDDSSEEDRRDREFKIHRLELALNDATDVEEVKEELET